MIKRTQVYYCTKCGAQSTQKSKICIRKDCDGDMLTPIVDRPMQ